MNYRDYLKKRAVKTSHQSDYEAYKKQRNRVNKLVKIGKVKYYYEVINKDQSNPKAMWEHISQLVGKGSKTTQIQRIKVNDSVYSQKIKILQMYLIRTLLKLAKISQARFRRQTFVSMSLLNQFLPNLN